MHARECGPTHVVHTCLNTWALMCILRGQPARGNADWTHGDAVWATTWNGYGSNRPAEGWPERRPHDVNILQRTKGVDHAPRRRDHADMGGLRSVSACRPHIGHGDGVGVGTRHRPRVTSLSVIVCSGTLSTCQATNDTKRPVSKCNLTIRWIGTGFVFDGGFGRIFPRHSCTHDPVWPVEPGDHTLAPQPIQL